MCESSSQNQVTELFPHQYLSEISSGSRIEGYYILAGASLRTTAGGRSFLSATVADRKESLSAICWDYTGPLSSLDEGKIVYIQGQVSEFKGALQVTLEEVREAEDEDSVDFSALVPVAPIDPHQMYQEILSIVDTMTDLDYQAVCREFLSRHAKAFQSIPAAKSVHHSFLHGLLMHTGNMLKAADALSSVYSQVVDRNLLLAGTLLHDFSKREEFSFSALGLVAGYSLKGQLLGHLVMGAQEVKEVCQTLNIPEEKSVLLQHMLLSHHGKPEYGAATVPMCAESDLLSMIDMLDSRMEIFRENFQQIPLGQFSSRIFALDGNRIYHHYEPESK